MSDVCDAFGPGAVVFEMNGGRNFKFGKQLDRTSISRLMTSYSRQVISHDETF